MLKMRRLQNGAEYVRFSVYVYFFLMGFNFIIVLYIIYII